MANELAVKVKVTLGSTATELQQAFQPVQDYATKHPVKVAVKIDKKSLENSLREAFGKDAANSIKKNLKNAVDVGNVGKNVFDNIIKGADELSEKAQKAQKILNDLHKLQEKEKYYTTQSESLKGNEGRIKEFELWSSRLQETKEGIRTLIDQLNKLDESKLAGDKRFDDLRQQIEDEKELYKARREDAALRAQQKSADVTNKEVAAEIREQKAAIDSVITAQEKLDSLQVKYYNELGAGRTDNAIELEQPILKAQTELEKAKDSAKAFGIDIEKDKRYMDALADSATKVTIAQNNANDAISGGAAKEQLTQEKAALDAVISALEKRDKLLVQKNNALKSGKTEDAARIQGLVDDANKELDKAIQNANSLGVAFRQDEQYIKAVNEGLVKVANAEQDVRRAQNNSSFKEKEADAKAAAEALNAYADANKKLIDAQRTGNEDDVNFYSNLASKRFDEANKAITEYEVKYKEAATDNVVIQKAAQAAFEKSTVAQNKYTSATNEAAVANRAAKASMDNYINSANTSIRNLTENYGKFGISMTDVTAKYQALETAVNNAVNNGNEANYLKEVTQCYKELGTAIAAATAEGQRYNNRLNNKKGFDNISAELDRFVNKNPNLSSNDDLWKQIRDLDTAVKNYSGTLEENQAAMAHVKAQAEALGLTTETLGQKFTRLWKEHFQTAAVMAGLHFVQQGMQQVYQSVVEVDTAMTELKKVTDETDASYANFTKRAAQQSRELGASISDYIQTTADWARLGYNLPDAEELARVSSLYANVGDGIESASQASEYLISTLKGFDLAASDAERVVDIINQVANTEPVSAQDLSEIMKRSSAALDAANTSFEKTVALGTAMNSVLQDSATTGTALKTLSMYLRATKTELEESGEDATYCASSMSKLRDSILGLTKGQVDIQLDKDTYKDVYDIMQEISRVYDQLTDKDQAALLNLLGGKRNANAIQALIQQFKIAEDTLAQTENAAGSAMRENETYLDSIQGKMSQMSSAFQKLSGDLLDSSLVKGLVDIGTAVIDVTDDIVNLVGVLPTLAGAFSSAFAVGGPKLTGSIDNVPTNTLMVTWNEQAV